jgi:glycosyltransferase involved in cell wall biosynthesis
MTAGGPMRLGIVNLTAGGFSGGYKKYLRNVLPRLAERSDVEALLCVSPEGTDVPGQFETPPVADYGLCRPFGLSHFFHIPDRKLVELLGSFSPDLLFLPVDRYIRFKDVPIVNMVHNMEPFVPNVKGDTLAEITKKSIQRKVAHDSVRRADHTIAVSSFVKDYLTETLGLREDKVSVVHHGVTPPLDTTCRRPKLIPVGWDDDFLFTCGSIRPARGLDDAVDALTHLRARNRAVRLVIAGDTAPGVRRYRDGLERKIAERGLSDSVCWAGSLTEREILWCYRGCRLFIMTSRVEACPNIVLEAMASGTISIAANNPPLPDFFSECATYYEPGNGIALAEAVVKSQALDPRARNAASERSRKRSATYSWDVTADRTMTVLIETLRRTKQSTQTRTS